MATSSFETTIVIDENTVDSLIDILEGNPSPEKALEILGSIPLTIPSHPHLLNLPPQCSSIEEVQKAYKVLESTLKKYRETQKELRDLKNEQAQKQDSSDEFR